MTEAFKKRLIDDVLALVKLGRGICSLKIKRGIHFRLTEPLCHHISGPRRSWLGRR